MQKRVYKNREEKNTRIRLIAEDSVIIGCVYIMVQILTLTLIAYSNPAIFLTLKSIEKLSKYPKQTKALITPLYSMPRQLHGGGFWEK